MTSAGPSPFALAQPELARIGYSAVIPLIPPSATHHAGRGKAPGECRGGHWRGLEGWTRFKDSSPSSFEVGMWSRMPDANVGLLLGTSAGGGSQLVAVDIDVTDADELALLQSVLPVSAMSKRGAKGITLMYRASPDLKSKAYDRAATDATRAERLVDLLAGGRQTCLPPSRHPAGVTYQWVTGPVAPSDLPLLTDDDLEKLEDTLETLGWVRDDRAAERDGKLSPRAVLGAFDPSDPWSVAKAEALARLDEWFPELGLPGTRRARGGWEAVAVWRPSSTGRPVEMRKRNLSACSTGIRDWGASGNDTGLTAIDVVQRALDLTASGALVWLQEKLGIEDDDGGVVIDLSPTTANDESDLPAPLRGLGAAPESQTPPDIAGGDTEGARVLGGPSTVAAGNADAAHGTPTEMPPHLLDCPGLVGDIIDYVVATARKPQRVLALATALTVVGTCGGRRYAGPTGSGTHLYCLAAAKSGASKDHGLDMAVRLLTAAEMTQHVGKGEWMSFQAVYKSLNRQPLSLNCIDEVGGFLKRINKRTSGGNEQAITAVLRTAWGKSFKMLPPPEWAGQDYAPIWSPALSVLGASTHEEFFRALEAGDTENGFLNRWLLFSTQERPAVQKPTADLFEVPASIVEGMKAIYQGGNPLVNATMHSGRCDRPEIVAQWADGEDGALNREYLTWAEQLDEASDAESFFARTAEQALRIATIRAMGCNPERPVIDRACFAWAKEVSLWCARRMLSDAREFMAENQTQSDRAKVVRAIRANTPLSQRDLLRKLTGFKVRELEEITKALEMAELIRVDLGPPATNNKRSKIYVWVGGK